MTNEGTTSPLSLLARQRSHLLIALSEPETGRESEFLHWYREPCARAMAMATGVVSVRHFERHEVDVTRGRYPPLPFRYLGIYELSLDGAEQAESVIELVTRLHGEQPAARAPATWLYYPVSEKVGRSPTATSSMVTIAFTNALPGQESEFREWYATRHIRHALNVPALVSGQCFQRTHFQRSGAMDAAYSMIAMYEQEGTPEEIVASIVSLPKDKLRFPMLDPSRFSEWVYRSVGSRPA